LTIPRVTGGSLRSGTRSFAAHVVEWTGRALHRTASSRPDDLAKSGRQGTPMSEHGRQDPDMTSAAMIKT
jgi:hypothetical protein